MSHLIVMRHAKAERGEGKADFDRELEERGWREADIVGQKLAGEGLVADKVLCSAARRTRDTFAAVLPHIASDCTVRLMESLYEADGVALREAVRRAKGECILLIGHNPSVHNLSLGFAGDRAREIGSSFPTSTAAVFAVQDTIDNVRFEQLVTPR